MGCFIVPATEAVVTTVATKVMERKHKTDCAAEHQECSSNEATQATRLPFVQKLKWLNHLLWGGSVLLCFEHVWHGEVVPFFPFLTAAASPEETAQMLHEMSTVGVTMAVAVTGVWAVMVLVSNAMEQAAIKEERFVKQEK